MQALFILVICIIAISVGIIAMVRTRLKSKSKELAEKLNHISAYSEKSNYEQARERLSALNEGHISSYSEKSNYEQARERLSALNEGVFIDIPSDLNNGFYGKVISATQEKDFINHYKAHFQEAYSLLKKLEAFNITPSETISKFINDFGRINKLVKQHNDGVITFLLDTHRDFFDHCLTPSETISKFINDFGAISKLVKQHNEGVITFLLDTHKDFFDHCLKYPLDKQQRRSIVSEEDNCLVVSSAGSGKTSSIVGKVKYLTEIKGIAPERILLISYTNKAAAELTERMATNGLKGYTFHKLAIDIIGKTTGTKPSICDNTDSLFVDIYHKLLDKSSFKKSIVEYFIDYQTNEADWEQRKNERREQLSEQKNVQLKAMFPDMDGRVIYVRSEQEQKICFVLSSLGVKFRYEEPYEHQLADEMHSQYRPDFSIYFEQEGVTKRIYLEHFGVDEHGTVPRLNRYIRSILFISNLYKNRTLRFDTIEFP
ncbi:uvrD/REP helicase [Tannerella sp. CAG:51]|nr:uvrD/REP helicase [Tannerella sp. CAG:51]